MKCPSCDKEMVEREIFVTRDAMIRGYNFMDDELIEENGKIGKYLPEVACDDCEISYCSAGAIMIACEIPGCKIPGVVGGEYNGVLCNKHYKKRLLNE